MRQRKFLSVIKSIIFVVIFIYLFTTISNLFQLKWTQAGAGNTVTVDEYNELAEDSVEVLFMGTSHVWFGIDPWYIYEKTGITSFTLANGSSRMEELYVLLEDALKSQTPKVVYLDASSFHYSGPNTESRAHRILDQIPVTDKAKIDFAFNNRIEDMTAIDVLVPLFRYHSRWGDLVEKDFTYGTDDFSVAPSRGHYISYVSKKAREDQFERDLDKPFEIEDYQIEYFRKFKALLDEKGIELVLMKIPNPDWNVAYSNAVQELADSCGVEFMDLTYKIDEIGLDPEKDYKDATDHINQLGCEKVTAYFIENVLSEYDLTDQRNAQWDKDLEIYLEYKDMQLEKETDSD